MTVKYTRVALVVPANYRDDIGLVPVDAAFEVLKDYMRRIKDWMAQEVGYAIITERRIHRSQLTARELGRNDWHEYPGAPLGGVGIDWGMAWQELDELGWKHESERRIAVFLNGGGFAGGWFNERDNVGQTVCGDWGLTWDVLGEPDAGCALWRGEAVCSVSGYRAFRHELGHAFGVSTHMRGSGWDNNATGEHMLPEQKDELLDKNAMFLWKVAEPEPDEPTPPTDAAKLAVTGIFLAAAVHAQRGESLPDELRDQVQYLVR